jgi:hypothetical protein
MPTSISPHGGCLAIDCLMRRLSDNGAFMRTATRILCVLCLFWNVVALAQQAALTRPDPELTPGDVFDVTIHDVCKPGYAKKV